MRVLVCGSRHFNDYELLEKTLNGYDITFIIEGEARGADTLARVYAGRRGIPTLPFPAQWDKHGRSAGPIRNRQMLIEGKPELIIAFRGPNSRGTQNMIDQAKKAGIPVDIVDILKEAGYGVVEGKDEVLKKIFELGETDSTMPLEASRKPVHAFKSVEARETPENE